MPKSYSYVDRALESLLPRRKADEVADKVAEYGIFDTSELQGRHIPAHFATDLGVSSRVLDKLARLLQSHGATLTR